MANESRPTPRPTPSSPRPCCCSPQTRSPLVPASVTFPRRRAMTIAVALIATTMLAGGPQISLRPCPADKQQPSGAMCGQVTVPENRAAAGGRPIALSLIVLTGRSATAKTDPVFSLAPGPGVGATRLAITYPRLYDMLQNDHD